MYINCAVTEKTNDNILLIFCKDYIIQKENKKYTSSCLHVIRNVFKRK